MLSIQDIGLSIFSNKPKNFYILGGPEYGIKDKYLEILVGKIGPKIEYQDTLSVIDLFTRNHIIPLKPQVYVVRYDKNFVAKATKELATMVLSLKIIGTVVLIYEDDKDLHKLDKLFPENTASIGAVDLKHRIKYLKTDFPNLNEKTVEYAAKHAINYYHAKSICGCLLGVQDKILLSEKQIVSLFDIQPNYSIDAVQQAIASRNFNAITYIAEHYDGDLQTILYQFLRVMIELDKIQHSKYSKSPLKEFAKKWSKSDIYWMFNHTYEAIKSVRNGYTVDPLDQITYLSSLMAFKSIPNLQVLS